MRKSFAGLLILSVLFYAQHAQARDVEYHLKIDEVMGSPEYKQKLGPGVAFFFASQKPPALDQEFGEYVTNKKTNSFGKPDEAACRWAMLSALIELRERAQKMGGDAVVNIVSYYKKNVSASETDYECHAGGIIAGVALRGTVVKLRH